MSALQKREDLYIRLMSAKGMARTAKLTALLSDAIQLWEDNDDLLRSYLGFRADVSIARSCCDAMKGAGYPPPPIMTADEQLALVARHLTATLNRHEGLPYRLIDLRYGRVWDFATGQEVADTMFLFTMWPPHAAVYKHGVRWKEPLVGDVDLLGGAFELWKPTPADQP